jgi:hypothetical protein
LALLLRKLQIDCGCAGTIPVSPFLLCREA